jgi:hypothetical protein
MYFGIRKKGKKNKNPNLNRPTRGPSSNPTPSLISSRHHLHFSSSFPLLSPNLSFPLPLLSPWQPTEAARTGSQPREPRPASCASPRLCPSVPRPGAMTRPQPEPVPAPLHPGRPAQAVVRAAQDASRALPPALPARGASASRAAAPRRPTLPYAAPPRTTRPKPSVRAPTEPEPDREPTPRPPRPKPRASDRFESRVMEL